MIYATCYSFYFRKVAHRLKPDLDFVGVPGSPERLRSKSRQCVRFAMFMAIPTGFEMIRASFVTTMVISIMPCVFGIWVMYSVWREVLHSKVPHSNRLPKRNFH